MEFKVFYSSVRIIGNFVKTFVPMKTIVLLTIFVCFLSATQCYSQTITLSLKNVSLEKTFKEIRKQTGYTFVYTREQINKSNPVSINTKEASLNQALDICFTNQPLTFIIEDKHIIVKDKPGQTNSPSVKIGIDITGKVINEQNDPVVGATVSLKGSNIAMATDGKGEFGFSNLKLNDVLYITSIGYHSIEIPIDGRTYLVITLQTSVATLDETIIKGYYTTTKRLNTGSVSKVTAEEIGRQPVSNPLATLQGLVPGLQVTQANGLPGSNFTVRIRGQNSIQSGNSPLYIIDGVPFLNDADVLTQRSGINANSPFNTIDPAEIESIEVLKDADATAIYGSRGANGVILITTKKGKSGKTSFDVNVNNGWGKVTRTIKFMNTPQYLGMRHEAFKNDGVTPDISNAYDFLVWDSTRYTNLEKLLIGNTAYQTNISANLSGGDEFTNFLIGSNYYKETTVFPGNNDDNRAAINLNLAHKTKDNKFNITLNASFANDNSNLIRADLTQYINLPPVIPALYDSLGKLSWSSGGFSFNNPLANLLRKYNVITDRLTANSLIEYSLFHQLKIKVNLGYSRVNVNEKDQVPISSQDPAFSPYGTAFFGKNEIKTWIIEPQVEYNKILLKKSRLQIQLGSTLQENSENLSSISASGYSNDNLLNSTTGAQSITSQVGSQLYHYEAIFAHINYNWSEKYILNLTGRRDGSSRFGPGKQFANFWATGAAWIFSSEKYFKNNLKFLSYGKLRGSYGITGNDLIGNYNYLDLYAQTLYPYQSQSSLFPVKLFNSDYNWEVIKKLDVALELGILNNRLLLTADWFKNRSTNQIINYSLPAQTGFNTVLKNFPGVVQNSGIELSIASENIKGKKIKWSTTFNITLEKNQLIEFPNLKTSSYSNRYIIGKPLNIYIGPEYLGVDLQTGVYQYLDKNKTPTFSPSSEDYTYIGTTDPKYYGGIENHFSYKNWQLDILFEFRKQMGFDPVFSNFNIVGGISNQPEEVLHRWQKTGDIATYEQFTQTFSAAGRSMFTLYNSSAKLTDASFCRLKNLSVSYNFPTIWLRKAKIEKCRLYVEGQNLFVITSYKGADPENQSLYQLPPLKRLVTGLQITF
jgi:TonB-dependent starch-binding outer membrane protein SusC